MENFGLHYCIALNRTILLFFPTQAGPAEIVSPSDIGRVVQVTLKQRHNNTVKELAMFYDVQYEVTKAVESVVFAHIFTSFPPEVRIEGEGYVLVGSESFPEALAAQDNDATRAERKSWDRGKKLRLKWDENLIHVCNDRWEFTYGITSKAVDSGTSSANACFPTGAPTQESLQQ